MHIKSSFLWYFYTKQNILIMIKNTQTPQKNTQNSLKSAILNRLQGKQSSDNDRRLNTSELIDIDEQIKEFGLMKLIEINQDWDHKGFFNFQNWMLVNKEIWGQEIKEDALELWKILRIANQGHVLLPTGLIFDLVNTLITNPSQQHLKLVLENFLKRNQIDMPLNSIRELRNYRSLSSILISYSGQGKETREKQGKKVFKKDEKVHQRLSETNKQKQNHLRHLKHDSLSRQLSECSFQPKISKHKPKPLQARNERLFVESKLEISEEKVTFKATTPDMSIFEGSVQDIPGVRQHIDRQQLCDFQRKRIKRFLKCPIGTLN